MGVARVEYSIEIREKEYTHPGGWKEENYFIQQVDIADSVEEAEKYLEKLEAEKPLSDNEYYIIYVIEYDENNEEMGYYPW